jgi:pentose-5-phosphate-3-epimerase
LHCMVGKKKFFSRTHAFQGVQLVYYHLREITDLKKFEARVQEWKKRGIKIGIVVRATDDVSKLKFPKGVRHILVLAVHPGPAGQTFNSCAIRTVSFLRKKFPHGILTVDGGITPAIVKKLARAGANAVTSSAYIWDSTDPQKAYRRLRNSKLQISKFKMFRLLVF